MELTSKCLIFMLFLNLQYYKTRYYKNVVVNIKAHLFLLIH